MSDITAIGPDSESVTAWRERCGINPENQVRLVKLAHMRYQHPDLDQITVFLQGLLYPTVTQSISVADRVCIRLWNASGQANCRRDMVPWIRIRSIHLLRAEGGEKVPGRYIRG